jgi:nickel/cobalt exporter
VKRLLAAVAGAITAAIVLMLLTATAAAAHPLGNFTVNSFSALRVQPSRILVDHVTDRAEIPTQQLTFADDPVSKTSSPAQIQAWSLRDCRRVAGKLSLIVAGRRETLTVESAALRFPPGAGGLPTSRLTCRLMTGSLAVGRQTPVSYQDRSDDGRVGWHEIIARGDETTLAGSDVPTTSVSRALTAYPKDLLSSPLAVKTAALVASAGGAAASDPLAGTDAPAGKEQRRGVDGLTVAFTDLVGRHQLSIGIGLLAVVLALVLGAFHAFAPGHGKTVMAAYLVADRGSLRQVSLIGLSVTATHTLGVLILGVLLSTFATFAPEKVYPWLGVASGLLLLSIGASLLRAAWRRRALWFAPPHDHPHDPDHPPQHDHPHDPDHPPQHDHPHEHDHPHDHEELTHAHPAGASRAAVLERPAKPLVHSHGGRRHSHAPITDEPVRLRNLLSMGLAGGLVPSPSALVVLVGAIALHRAWFGVVLVVFYGAGMAATLVGIGFLLSRLRGRFIRRVQPASLLSRAFGTLPLLTAGLICVIGTVLAIRGLGQA